MKKRLIIALFFITSPAVFANSNDIEPVHYAFSNYLGNGIYRTANQSVTLINLPFEIDLNKKNNFSYGIRLPLSIGFFDFDFDDIPELNFPDQVGTVTFTPGLSIGYQLTKSWSLESYFDIGFAHNFTTSNNVAIQSGGVSALYNFNVKKMDAVWVSRTYIASYNGIKQRSSDSYAALQSGVDIGLPTRFKFFGRNFQPRFFANMIWYYSEVNFFNATYSTTPEPEQNVSLQNSIELGATFRVDKGFGYDWASIENIGLGYRFTNEFSALRFIFSMPL